MPALLLYCTVNIVATLPMGLIASTIAWLCRAEEVREWNSLVMLVTGIGHIFTRRVFNAGRYASEAIRYPLRSLAGYLRLQRRQEIISKYAWTLAYSRAADFVAERVVDVTSLRNSVSYFINSIIILIARGGVVAQESSLQQNYTMPLWFLGPLLGPFVGAYMQIKNTEIFKSMASNSIIYNSLPLIKPVEKDVLDSRSILVRLLKLLPGDEGHPVRCTLGVVDLASPDMEVYEALSYVWGPPGFGASILVNDQPFRVSYLLFQALVHLRDKKTPRSLWIDALCVNQSDLAERSSQVLYMHQIYSSAARVIVWLGGEEPWGLKHTLLSINLRQNDGFTPAVHFGITRVIANLLRRPWWTRVWIVQEFILARSIQIQCGSCTVSWDQFCVLVDGSVMRSFFPKHRVYLGKYQALREAREFRTSRTSDLSVQTQRDSKLREATDNQSRHATDLLSLIYNFRSWQATEPRDKVFAFLGLAEDNQEITLLNPDYKRYISFLSIDLARNHIHHCRTLSVVALAECTRRSLEKPGGSSKNSGDYIPTWCPSFMSSDVYYGLTWQPFWTGLATEESRFFATSHLPIRSTSAVASSPLVEMGTYTFDKGFYNLTIHVLSNLKAKISDDCRLEGVDELIAQTKTNMNRASVLPKWRSLAQEAALKRAALGKEPRDDILTEEPFHLTLTAGRFSAAPLANDPREAEYLQTRRRVCSNRRFFVTHDGRFGIGPDNLKTGDEVHVVMGMQVPVILRKASDEWGAEHTGWIYVGQAYVHDWMVYGGDLQDDIESGRVELEEIVLI
ncbi:hypothetical protein CJF32_00005382 [Rutstroemia sp. NJR-2017a WRK4]|nr:hypothetical protein CJF32_00005382 [Rutstroemia sp. NJR-2017a WRK4]